MRRMKTTDGPSAASHNDFGVRGLVRAFGKRLVAVECGKASNSPGPLDAALLWRQVAQAAKAVTSHRTPNACRLCTKFHPCSTDGHRFDKKRRFARLSYGSAFARPVHPCSSVSIRGFNFFFQPE